MSREIRRVPPDWKHPQDGRYSNGSIRYIGLHNGADYQKRVKGWDDSKAKWDRGEFPDYADAESRKLSFEEWEDERPKADDYMPQWAPDQATHFMMYETCTEGSPISPAFADIESLARWLADNRASAFGGMTATYEQWLATCKAGWAISGVFTPETGLISGVEFNAT